MKDWRAAADLGTSAIQPLWAAILDSDDDVSRGAAEALGQIDDDRAIEVLLATLTEGTSTRKRIAAARVLGQINKTQGIESLVAMLNHGDRWVRLQAAGALKGLFLSGKLSTHNLKLIAAHRGRMSQRHVDRTERRYSDSNWRDDQQPSGGSYDYHEDSGIGVDL